MQQVTNIFFSHTHGSNQIHVFSTTGWNTGSEFGFSGTRTLARCSSNSFRQTQFLLQFSITMSVGANGFMVIPATNQCVLA
jgi:hypothetical protein